MELTLYLRAFRRGWWIILLMILVAANVSLVISYFTPLVYQTNVRFIVSPNASIFTSSWDIVSSLDTLDRRSIINTYKELLASSSVYGKSPQIQQIGQDVVANEYGISVVVVPDTNILTLTVEGPTPQGVVDVARAISSQALGYINQLYPVYNFNVLDDATFPTSPVRPDSVRNAGLAAVLGAIVGLVLAFSREQLQNTIEKLRERSTVDVASSAYTRAYFERRVREEMIQQPDASLSIGIVNFRGLDEVANILPEPIMDRLMHTVTNILKNELRGRDIVGRWDETKLIVLLPSTPNSAVEATFKRIQMYLAQSVYIDKVGDMMVLPDPCIGIAARDQFETSDELLRRAELAMERASSLEDAAVVFLSKPFVFTEGNEIG
jgi:diguanylate cyclase (GGDEF)-like protein